MSGIYIKGMKMPKTCDNCFLPLQYCPYAMKPNGECPLVPVQSHGRLIEAEPIMKFITDGLNSGKFGYDQIEVLTEIQYAPTIIPAEEGE